MTETDPINWDDQTDETDQADQDDQDEPVEAAPAPAPTPKPPPVSPSQEAITRQRILQWGAANNWPAYQTHGASGVKLDQGKRDWQIYSSFFSARQIMALDAALRDGE